MLIKEGPRIRDAPERSSNNFLSNPVDGERAGIEQAYSPNCTLHNHNHNPENEVIQSRKEVVIVYRHPDMMSASEGVGVIEQQT